MHDPDILLPLGDVRGAFIDDDSFLGIDQIIGPAGVRLSFDLCWFQTTAAER
jgi:hypothetical protein